MSGKRPRTAKPHEDKKKVQALLEFPTEKLFDEWRDSRLVKPWWDTYVSQALDGSDEKGKKLLDVENLIHRIHEGERLGKRKYKAAREAPQFDTHEDYHAWLVLWLSKENTKDRYGCFWGKQKDKHTVFSAMHTFVLWARRQRHREKVAAEKSTSKKKVSAKGNKRALESDESGYETADEELDPERGTALVLWNKGCPDEVEENGGERITIDRLCSHTTTSFWIAVEKGFDLPKHMHRRTELVSKDGRSLPEVQQLANNSTTAKKFIFYLETEPATLVEEVQAAPDSTIARPEDIALRESMYKSMVEEAITRQAHRLDTTVRLWRYNIMRAAAKDGDRVDISNVALNLSPQDGSDNIARDAAIQAIQYTHDLKSLNREIEADDAARNSTDDEGDVLGLPLTMIHDITQEEIDSYTKMNVWIDNKAYQPQNHAEACKNLGIENPEQPHIQGFLPSIVLDRHQPTAINALTEFEDSCVGAGLNAEEVGLGKTVETIGLLLHRSNQRKAAISAGVPVAKALPTLIILPQNLIQQWNTEIFQFTDVFNLVIYYGPPRKSGDEKIAYIPKSVNKGRLTRSHELFNGNEENANTIVITSYATYAARHGPNVQWKWLVEERKKKLKRDGQPATKKAAEDSLAQEGIRRNSVHEDCPHQLHGLFERVILDEGHTIRHQSDDVGFAVSNIGSRYRHILSGTPTFDNIEEFAGIMRFLQNPVLSQKKHLLEMGFTEHQLKNGSHDRPGKVTPLESALYFVDPYSLADDDVKMPLRYTSEAMEKYLFNKVYNDSKEFGTEEQGRRLAMVLQKIMLRRTQTSILDGIAIAKSLPRVQRSVFECEFTPTERAHYEYMMEDESSKLFKKSKNEKAVEWSTTAYRKWSLLASWLGFEYLLDYKAATLKSRRKNMDALSILRDVRKGQERLKIPKAGLLPITKDTKTTEIQKILEWHCAGSPKLRQLLPLLAEIVVLRKEKALIWVNNPAQAEWLEHILALCGIKAAQLRNDLPQRQQDKNLQDFNSEKGSLQVLICSYMISCAGLNLQKACRTSIEFEPPPNEPIRVQELGRVRRRGQLSAWVRHIMLLTKDTLNTKQDSDAILKNLPNLMTQLNMDVWGKDDKDGESRCLGDFVLHEDELYPAKDPRVVEMRLEPLGADELLVQIQMKLLGRKTGTTVSALREQATAKLSPKKPKVDGAVGQTAGQKAMGEGVSGEEGTKTAPANAKRQFPEEPLWV